jgi:DNA-nicking Smr family endonuclease
MPHNLSKEDLALWLSMIENIKPIEREESQEPPIVTRKRSPIIERKSSYPVQHASHPSPLQSLTRQQYRNYTIDARLDLHGYTPKEAYKALVQFVNNLSSGLGPRS